MKFTQKIRERMSEIFETVEELTSDGLPYEESSDLFEVSYEDMTEIAEELVKYIEQRCIQPNEPSEDAEP
mgnify:FL=1